MHEVKWDGMRVLVDVRDGRLRLTSRNENDVTVSFPELRDLPGDDLLLDAEVVAFLDGIPTFGALQERIHVGNAKRAAALAERNPVTLLAFDLLRLDGRDLTREPLDVRRDLLVGLGLDDVAWQVPPRLRRRRDAVPGDPRPGPGGDGQQAAVLPLRASAPAARTG